MNTSLHSPFAEISYWDHVSDDYSNVAKWIMETFAKEAIKRVTVQPDDSVIDVACGTGILSLLLSDKAKHITAIDFSPKMISFMNDAIQSRKVTNIQVIEGNGQKLPCENETFDAAFSMFGLMFFPDRRKGFEELLRVLKPGKRAAITSWASIEKSSLMTLALNAFGFACPDSPPLNKGLAPLGTIEVFKDEMEEAGFQNVHIHAVQCSNYPLPPLAFWEIVSGGGPLSILKKEMGTEKWQEISDRAVRYLKDKTGENGIETYTTAYIGIGMK